MNELPPTAPAQEDGKPTPADQPLHLLYAEDNPLDLQLITRVLNRSGYRLTVEPVDQPELFRQRLGESDYDVIISDFNLNDWTAIDALEILHDSGKDIPLVVVSGSLEDEAAVECIKRGAADYVLKDRLARLPTAIQHALEAKSARGEQRKAETVLRASTEQYQTLFEANPNPMWVFDAGNKAILAVNDAAVLHYGYSCEEFLEMTIDRLWIADEVPSNLSVLEALESHANQTGAADPLKHRTKSGELIEVEVSGNPLQFKGCDARLLQAVDVTERNSLQAQVLQSQKMESLGSLAGGVAHDLNNLLGVVLGYADITLDGLDGTSPLRSNVDAIHKAADSAVSVVRQLLAFSRKQMQQPRLLSLNQVVRDMEELLRRLIGEDIQLSIVTDPLLGTVKADPVQMEQIVMNLVVNARDAMPQGGPLTITTANVGPDEAVPGHGLVSASGPQVMLEVTDAGTGMDAATQARIFEPFFTTKEPGKGTGLGLATVYGIVKQSAGSISVRSELGRGTTFRICLPRVEGAPQPKNGEKKSGEVPAGSETILLVEDAAPLREVARRFLRQGGYTVIEAENGAAALAAAQAHTGPIHLLLTDVVMPGLSGPQLAKELRAAHPGLPVLYMSGYTDEALGHHGVLEEGVQLLDKPFTRGALLRKLREILDPLANAPPLAVAPPS